MTAYSQPLKGAKTPQEIQDEIDGKVIEAAHILANGFDIIILEMSLHPKFININGDLTHAMEFFAKLDEIIPGQLDLYGDEDEAKYFIE